MSGPVADKCVVRAFPIEKHAAPTGNLPLVLNSYRVIKRVVGRLRSFRGSFLTPRIEDELASFPEVDWYFQVLGHQTGIVSLPVGEDVVVNRGEGFDRRCAGALSGDFTSHNSQAGRIHPATHEYA
jgi:hypothetical protein